MAEEKDIALLADNDIIVEIEVQEAPTVVVESPSTTTAEISGDSAIGIVVSALPTLAKEKTLADGIASIEGKFDNIKVNLTPAAKEETLVAKSQAILSAIQNINLTPIESKVDEGVSTLSTKIGNIDLSSVAKQGDNVHATNTAIYESLKSCSGYIRMTNSEYDEFKAHIVEVTNNILN